ncbi:hypothetical protein ANCCAN_24820 [Ancylostoma caninum]|uniref:G-protein coupled receptors family 1 profile domain-containing protein n=1 Tax=Ancylostoma caninum TaxID=29170 RepID=A0A368FB56_ANCCA|nr:hypothetical protein ANCCAN_24820 [Ancylostoma caninum]
MPGVLLNGTNITDDNSLEDAPTEESMAMNLLEGGLILVVCVVGMICNSLSFLVLIRHKTFRNSFGFLTAYHALSNAAILLIFTVWAVPWTIIPIPEQLYWANLRVGQLSLFFVETAFHCSLFISINRFVAITFPMKYRRIFTNNMTVAIVVFVSVISALYWGVYFKSGCDFFFDHVYRVWSFGSEPCSVWLSFHIDMAYNVCLFLVVGAVDVMTLLQLRSMTKNIRAHRTNNDKSGHQNDISRRQRKELLFFMQAFMNSLIYAFMLVCFHLISRVVQTDFELFLCTTFIWGLSHAGGGYVILPRLSSTYVCQQ